ncbi:M28 family peptidase [Virgisporangium aliadipatigenens]|uniref:M28 family peptidase n=1 Tax=Virgisporangium aliadipatigenens TaxID=741659 RepID=UPI001EF17BD3|nr:M28 family peptidase [Virgisporangium aliadipatigenens]
MPDRSFPAVARRPWVAAAVLTFLVAVAALAVYGVTPPAPRPESAASDEFSAGRAFRHVRRISEEVHVTGSPAADRVREYLVATLTGYGLRVETQETTGVSAARFGDGNLARVRNVIARLPGSAGSTGRLIIVAHYDAVQVSHGANDDGAGTATILEVARIMAAAGTPRNEIVFLLTDAEEAGLNGAEAFADLHPLGRDRAVVLNLEARGSSGPVVMFETSRGNARLIDVFAQAPHPVGSSVAVEVYRLLSNDTDFTPFLKHERFTGLNAAYIDGAYAYHSPQDTAASMSRASLQHHGDNALALVRAFGRADLGPLSRPASGDATYFPLPGGLLARYPAALVWPFAVLALVAVGLLTHLARRRGLTTYPRTLASAGLALVPVVIAVVAVQLLSWELGELRPDYRVVVDPRHPGWFRIGFLTLGAAALFGWYALLRRRIGPVPLAIGALGLLSVFGVVMAAVVPGGSYLTALPALFGAAALIGGLYARPAWARVALRASGPFVAVLILAPIVYLFLPALGISTPAAPVVFAVFLGLAGLPALELLWRPVETPRRRLLGATPALVLLAVAVLATSTALAVDRPGPDNPVPSHLMYALDKDTGTARWVSEELSPTEWTGRYLDGEADLSAAFPVLPDGRLAVGPAQPASLPAPELRVESDTAAGAERHLTLRVVPLRTVRMVAVYAPVGERRVLRATVNGRDTATWLEEPGRFGFQYHGVPAEGIELKLVLAGDRPLALRVLDGSDGLDGLPGFRARPADVGVVGSHSSELVCVARTVTV